MNLKVKGWVVIQDDENSAIIVAKDNYKSIAVQIIWQNDSTVADARGELQAHRNIFCVHSKTIFTHYKDDSNKEVINPMFKQDIQKAIVDVKKVYESIMAYEAMIDGVLTDYKSQHKDLNKEEN